MIVATAARLLAVLVLLAATPTLAVDRLGTVAGWDLFADAHPDARPYCYAAVARGAGDRITLLRGDPGLVVILSRAAWPSGARALDIEIALDDDRRETRAANLDDRSLVLVWDDEPASRRALAGGSTLRLTDGDLASAWDLADGGAALTAIERCFSERMAAHERGLAVWRAGFASTAPATEPAAIAAERLALAADFTRWLARAAPDAAARVTPTTGVDAVYALRTALGTGRLRLLEGGTHATVLAGGEAWLRAACRGESVVAEHAREDVAGMAVVRTGLACAATARGFEAVMLSYRDAPGGLLLVVPAAAGRGGALTADIVADLTVRGRRPPTVTLAGDPS